jgi:hypothetical protein
MMRMRSVAWMRMGFGIDHHQWTSVLHAQQRLDVEMMMTMTPDQDRSQEWLEDR